MNSVVFIYFIFFFRISHVSPSVATCSQLYFVPYALLLKLQLTQHIVLESLQFFVKLFPAHFKQAGVFEHLFPLCLYLPQLKHGLTLIML